MKSGQYYPSFRKNVRSGHCWKELSVPSCAAACRYQIEPLLLAAQSDLRLYSTLPAD